MHKRDWLRAIEQLEPRILLAAQFILQDGTPGGAMAGDTAFIDILVQTDGTPVSFAAVNVNATSNGQPRTIGAATPAQGVSGTFSLFNNTNPIQGSQFTNRSGLVPFFRVPVTTQPGDADLTFSLTGLDLQMEPGFPVTFNPTSQETFSLGGGPTNNVTAMVVDGELQIVGDENDNQIEITDAGGGITEVTGLGDTTVNDLPGGTFPGVASWSFFGNEGDDFVESFVNAPGQITGGPDNDTIRSGPGDDNIVWNNGDGSDIVDGGGGGDQQTVMGDDGLGDNFNINPNGNRVELSIGLFTLDIGTVETLEIEGLGGNDVLISGNLTGTGVTGVHFAGGEGNDSFNATAQGDTNIMNTVSGGNGNDTLRGGPGADLIKGGPGDDLIFGGLGNDVLKGGLGVDQLSGEGDRDLIVGGRTNAEDDKIQSALIHSTWKADGQTIEDSVAAVLPLFNVTNEDNSANTLDGGDDSDFLLGDMGADVLLGGGSNDRLQGGPGNDDKQGGPGDDLLIWNNGDGSDMIEGGDDDDTTLVTGDPGEDDFSIESSSGRVLFQRNNLGLFTLDIGTVENLDVNSDTGDDLIILGTSLSTTALDDLFLDGGPGNNDMVDVQFTPTPTITGDPSSFTLDSTPVIGGQNFENVTGVNEPVTDPVVGFSLQAFDLGGNPITQVTVGNQFDVRVFVEDLRDPNGSNGVSDAFIDLLFNGLNVLPISTTSGPAFPNNLSGNLSQGMFDELGGTDGASPPTTDPELLVSVRFQADFAGDTQFAAEAADTPVRLSDSPDVVDTNLIDYGDLLTVTINEPTNTGSISGRKILDSDRNGQTATGGDVVSQWLMQTPDPVNPPIPVVGDWGAATGDEFATFDPTLGTWSLDTTGDHQPDTSFQYGSAGQIPVPGIFGGGSSTSVAVYDPTTDTWSVDFNDNQVMDDTPFVFGVPGAFPLVGDWDNDGDDDVGYFVPGDQTTPGSFVLDLNGDRINNDTPLPGMTCSTPGLCEPVAGDWDGDGDDDIGFADLGTLRQAFFDVNDDGFTGVGDEVTDVPVNFIDLAVFRDEFFGRDTVGAYNPTTGQTLIDRDGDRQFNEPRGQYPAGGTDFYIDDIIVGFAERGEMVYNRGTGELFVGMDGDGSFSLLPELGVQGIVIELFEASDLVNPIGSTTTGPDGSYLFGGLSDGTYVVRENFPDSGGLGDQFDDQVVIDAMVTIENGAAVAGIDLHNTLREDPFDMIAPNNTPDTATLLNPNDQPFAFIDFATIGPLGEDPHDYWDFVSPTPFVEYEFNVIEINNNGTVDDQENNVQIEVEATDDPGNVLSQDDGEDGQVSGVVVTGGGKTQRFDLSQADKLGPGAAAALRGFIVAHDEGDGPNGNGNDDMPNATVVDDDTPRVGTITPAVNGNDADQDFFRFDLGDSLNSVTITPRGGEPFNVILFDDSGANITVTLTVVTNPITGQVEVTGFEGLTGPLFAQISGLEDDSGFTYDLETRLGTASISGTVFEDLLADGKTPDDPARDLGVELRLFEDNGDGVFDPNVDVQISLMGQDAVTGGYSFGGLSVGSYFVDINPSSLGTANQQTGGGNFFPAEPFYSVTITQPDEVVTNRDFDVAQFVSFSGKVVDSQGVFLPGVTVTLMRAGAEAGTAITDSDGKWSRTGLLPGPYEITYSLEGFGDVTQRTLIEGGLHEDFGTVPLSVADVVEEIIVGGESPLQDDRFNRFGDTSDDQVTTETENGNNFNRVEERSDAGITADLSLPDSVTDLFFDFRFPQAGVGDELQVNVIVGGNTTTLAAFVATDFPGADFQFSGPISLRDFAGQDVTLELRLATVDPVDSIVDLDNLVIKAEAFESLLPDTRGRVEYIDSNGNDVTVSLRGDGLFEVRVPSGSANADALAIVATGTTSRTNLTVQLRGRDTTTIGDILVDGPISQVNAKNVDLLGDLETGPVKTIRLNNVADDHNITISDEGAGDRDAVTLFFNAISDLVLTSLIPIRTLTAASWVDTNPAEVKDKVEAPSISRVNIKGNRQADDPGAFEADIVVDNSDPNARTALGNVTVAGPATGVNVVVTGGGSAGNLTFRGAVNDLSVAVDDKLNKLSTGVATALDVAADTINSVSTTGSWIGGSLTGKVAKTVQTRADRKTDGDPGAGHLDGVAVQLTGDPSARQTLSNLRVTGGARSGTTIDLMGDSGNIDIRGAVDGLNVTVASELKNLRLGDVSDADLSADEVNAVRAVRWVSGDVVVTKVKRFDVTGSRDVPGDAGVNVTVNGTGDPDEQVLGNVNVRGLADGVWRVLLGAAGNLSFGDVGAGFDAIIAGGVRAFASKAALAGAFVAAQAFGRLDIKTNVIDSMLIAGGSGGAASVGNFRVGDDFTNSTLVVGVDSVDGVFGNGDDVLLGGEDNFVKTMQVGGAAPGVGIFTAGAFPKSVRIDGVNTDPLSDDRFVITPV